MLENKIWVLAVIIFLGCLCLKTLPADRVRYSVHVSAHTKIHTSYPYRYSHICKHMLIFMHIPVYIYTHATLMPPPPTHPCIFFLQYHQYLCSFLNPLIDLKSPQKCFATNKNVVKSSGFVCGFPCYADLPLPPHQD